jgi:NAD(P) transhydrogenase subunit alpha
MVQGMRPGSVVVDLAAESGGNVEGSVPGRDIHVPTADGKGTVTVVGLKDAPSAMPTDASRLYAKNVANLLALMTRDGTVDPDFDDDVIAGACLTHDGVVRHPPTAEALAALAGNGAPGSAQEGAPGGASEDTANEADSVLTDQMANDPVKASENEGVV